MDIATHYLSKMVVLKFYYFHNDVACSNKYIVRRLKDPFSKRIDGQLYLTRSASDPAFRLIAKSKHSSNHQISEVFRYSRNEWETHKFFGPPTFATHTSLLIEQGYKDYMRFYERK